MNSVLKYKNLFLAGIFYGLLLFTILFQLYYAIYTVKDFNWLEYLDPDINYQVERFLLSMRYPGIQEFNTYNVDYGSELYLLTPIFKLSELLVNNKDPLNSYYFLIFAHLLFSALSLLLIRYIVIDFFDDHLTPIILSLLIVSLPLYIQYMSFVKPDPNAILFCITFGMISLHKYHKSWGRKWLLLAVVLSALGTAIKWWGIFMVFPISHTLYIRRNDNEAIDNIQICFQFSIWVILLLSVYLYAKSPLTDKVLAYIYKNLISKKGSGDLLDIYWFKGGVFLCFCLLGAGFSMIIHKSKNYFKDWEAGKPLLYYFYLIVAVLTSLSAFYMFFGLPFLVSEQLVMTFLNFSQFFILGLKGSGYEPGGPLINAIKWGQDSFRSGFLSPIVMGMLIIAIYLHIVKLKKTKSYFLLNIISLYLLPIMVFLFFFVTKINEATQAMLFPLIILYISVAFLEYLKSIKNYRFYGNTIAILFCVSIIQVIVQNTSSHQPPVLTFYNSRKDLGKTIDSMNKELANLINTTKESDGKPNLILFNRDFPISDELFHCKRVYWRPYSHIQEKISLQVDNMDSGDYFLFTEEQAKLSNKIIENTSISLVHVIRGKKFRRSGRVDNTYKAYVFRKI